MSNSPPAEKDVEQSAQSGEEQEMDREQEGAQAGLGDFEVKEQDRWLPIANGWCCFILPLVLSILCATTPFPNPDLLVPCVTTPARSRSVKSCLCCDSPRACNECKLQFRQHPHSSGRLLFKAMICIAAPLSLASAVLGPLRVKLPSTCPLMALQSSSPTSLIQGQVHHHKT